MELWVGTQEIFFFMEEKEKMGKMGREMEKARDKEKKRKGGRGEGEAVLWLEMCFVAVVQLMSPESCPRGRKKVPTLTPPPKKSCMCAFLKSSKGVKKPYYTLL